LILIFFAFKKCWKYFFNQLFWRQYLVPLLSSHITQALQSSTALTNTVLNVLTLNRYWNWFGKNSCKG